MPIQAATSLAVVNLNEQGHPDYAFYREGVADRQVSSAQMSNDCAQHASTLQLVCTGALALDARDQHIYLPWLQAQKQAGQCLVIDANLRPSVMPDLAAYRACVHEFLKVADIIKVSDEDLKVLNLPGHTAIEQAQHLLDNTQAKLIALTLGADGAWLLHASGNRYYGKESTPLNIVDTVGAGDTFLAGLLAALIKLSESSQSVETLLTDLCEQDAQALLAHAIASASLCVQARGCQPASWEQTVDWARNHPFAKSH